MSLLAGYRGLPPADDAWRTYNLWLRNIVEPKRAHTRTPADAVRVCGQQQLLAAAADSADAFAAEMRPTLGCSAVTHLRFPLPAEPLTADELRHPDMVWETALHYDLTGAHQRNPATRADAAQTVFWIASHITWLEQQKLPDPPLEAFVHKPLNLALLETAADELDADARLAVDDAARELLRRLGGLAHVRGATVGAIQTDCPTMRAWWRVETSRQAAEASNNALSFEDCYETFANPGVWVAYVSAAMSRSATLAAGRCAAGFVLAAQRHQIRNDEWPTRAESTTLLSNMARRSAGMYPALLHHSQLADLAAS